MVEKDDLNCSCSHIEYDKLMFCGSAQRQLLIILIWPQFVSINYSLEQNTLNIIKLISANTLNIIKLISAASLDTSVHF